MVQISIYHKNMSKLCWNKGCFTSISLKFWW